MGVSGGTEEAEFEKRVQDALLLASDFRARNGWVFWWFGGGSVRGCFCFFFKGPFRFQFVGLVLFFWVVFVFGGVKD